MCIHFPENVSMHKVSCSIADNLIYLKCRINGSEELSFIFDSGATFNVLDIGKAKEIGINLSDKRRSEKTGLEYIQADNIEIEIGGLVLHNQPFKVIDTQQLTMFTGCEISGILGFDVLNDAVIKIGYGDSMVTFYDKEKFIYAGNGETIRLEIRNKWPVVPVRAYQKNSMSKDYELIVDTGSLTSLSLYDGSLAVYAETVSTGISVGINGVGGAGRIGRLESLSFGKTDIKNPLAAFPPEGNADEGDSLTSAIGSVSSGIIGGELLKHFDITFDYSRGQFILEKNMNFNETMDSDMSGLVLLSNGAPFDNINVFIVIENTPSQSAGILQGDRIIEINGRSAVETGLAGIRQILKRESDTVILKIDRNGEALSISFGIKRLV